MTETIAVPEIKVKWLRGPETIDFARPNTYLVVGQRGTGKSSLLESIATRYPKVIDLFGSKDSECLAWCKPESPFHDILFIVGKGVTVVSQWPQVSIDELTLKDFEAHQVILTTHVFYSSSREYFSALQQITELLWEKRTSWTEPWIVLVREAANWVYSRLQIVKDSNLAKADFVQLLREARHSGLAVAVDTLRWTSLDKEVRDVADFFFMKRVGAIGLPKDLRFIYRYVQPFSMMKLDPEVFVMLTSQGNICIGKFDYPIWHKEEKENILHKINVQVSYEGRKLEQGLNVTVFEHSKIMETYIANKSMRKTAALLKRSSDTIFNTVKRHDENIESVGYCYECRTALSPLEKEKAKRMGRMMIH